MHLNLKQSTAGPPAGNAMQQQERFDAFIRTAIGDQARNAPA